MHSTNQLQETRHFTTSHLASHSRPAQISKISSSPALLWVRKDLVGAGDALETLLAPQLHGSSEGTPKCTHRSGRVGCRKERKIQRRLTLYNINLRLSCATMAWLLAPADRQGFTNRSCRWQTRVGIPHGAHADWCLVRTEGMDSSVSTPGFLDLPTMQDVCLWAGLTHQKA